MTLLNKTSNLSLKTTKTGRGRSGDSKLLNQSTPIPKESPIGNPNSNKLPQSVVVEKNSPVGNPNSNKLSQSTLVERNSPLNNPISSKISQTQNAFFNIGKSNQFTRGGMVETFTGTRVFGANAPLPPPPPSFLYNLTFNSSSTPIVSNTVLSFTASFTYAPVDSYELYFISASDQYSATPNQLNFVDGSGSIVFSGIPVESETPYLASGSVTVANIKQDPDVDFTASLQKSGLSTPVSTIGDSLLTKEFLIEYEPSAYDAFIIRVDDEGAIKENLAQISSSFLPNIESQTL